jgi:hypothetical protein
MHHNAHLQSCSCCRRARRRDCWQSIVSNWLRMQIEYLADYEKRWMLESFRELDDKIFAPAGRTVDWVFLEVRHSAEDRSHPRTRDKRARTCYELPLLFLRCLRQGVEFELAAQRH